MSETRLKPADLVDALQDRIHPSSGRLLGARAVKRDKSAKVKLVDALRAIVPFEKQDPDEQFYPARCGQGKHYWHENADAEGDTCNCGEWYRFADRIEETPQ